jgi:hypothetical protein
MIEIIYGIIIVGTIGYILYDCKTRQDIVLNYFGDRLKKRGINDSTDDRIYYDEI